MNDLDKILDEWDEYTSGPWGKAMDRRADLLLMAPHLYWALARAAERRAA